MLYGLCLILVHRFHFFHAFQYLTLRSILAILTAWAISLATGPLLIRFLKSFQIGQMVRDDGPKTHFSKAGTPTMGGALIITTIIITTLLWANWDNRFIWIVLVILFGFGLVGWVDDYRKLAQKNTRGLPAKWKYFWQSVLGLGAALFLFFSAKSPVEIQLLIPFSKHIMLPLGFGFVILTYFVIVGTSNAVNLTDGLDGLAILPIVLVGGALGIFAYVSGNEIFARYLEIPYVRGVGELTIFCSALIGSGLGFLWFNTYPALVFMGDVGALGIGAALGAIAVMVRQELILFLMGGVFVAETVSVIIQVLYFKKTGKRVFRMAPLHHHFELLGWPEPRVIVRFWIVTVILVLLGLASLKLR